jgi:hypothetical protein
MADTRQLEMKIHALNDKLRAALARIDKLEKLLNDGYNKGSDK